MNNPRIIALDILIKYIEDDSYLNIELNHALNTSDLSSKDKSLVTTLVYGTIQNKLYLDYLLKPYVKKVKNFEYMLLLMSMYQHYFLDKIPDYAIVSEAVNIAKNKNNYTAKFINAVLKNIFNSEVNLDNLDELERLSILTSHPLWLVKMLNKQYDLETTTKILYENNKPSTQIARINTLLIDDNKLLEDDHFKKHPLGKYSYIYQGSSLANTDYFKKGYITIQDASSQLVAEVLNPTDYSKVLDMCSAPGGKTTHLSQIMHNTGIIYAHDLYEHKIKLINDNASRLHITNIKASVYDATKLDEIYYANSFDYILLDAPCSGLGVLKRKPEIKYHDSSVMDTLIPLQKELLEISYKLLKNNSIMVYSTCTINKKENQYQIKQFLESHPDMTLIHEQCILPYEYHTDGFYIAKLKKGE